MGRMKRNTFTAAGLLVLIAVLWPIMSSLRIGHTDRVVGAEGGKDSSSAERSNEGVQLGPNASLGGRRHPWVSRSLGGLVKHTRLVAWWACRLADRDTAISPQLVAEAVAACLLHDLCKFHRPDATYADGPYVTLHGHWAAAALCDLWGIDETVFANATYAGTVGGTGLPPITVARIVLAVNHHMGRWSEDYTPDVREMLQGGGLVVELVQAADFCAAQQVDDVYKELADGSDGRYVLDLAGRVGLVIAGQDQAAEAADGGQVDHTRAAVLAGASRRLQRHARAGGD